MSVAAPYGVAVMCNVPVVSESATWAESLSKFVSRGATSLSEAFTFWRPPSEVPHPSKWAALSTNAQRLTSSTEPSRSWEASLPVRILSDPNEMELFVEKHPFLIPLLRKAIKSEIPRSFGFAAAIEIELRSEPETGFLELFVWIASKHEVEESLSCLEDFDERWWMSASASARCLLNFSVKAAI